jgi:hypothetical protein
MKPPASTMTSSRATPTWQNSVIPISPSDSPWDPKEKFLSFIL